MLELTGSALEVIGQFMDLLPDYEQKKAEEFHKLRTEYESEQKKPYGFRNDQLVLDLSDELRRYVQDFSASIPQSSLASLRQAGC